MDTSQEMAEQADHEKRMSEDAEYRDAYVARIVEERISIQGDCYPWAWDKIQEAIANKDYLFVSPSLKDSNIDDDDAIYCVTKLRECVYEYWHDMAITLTKHDMATTLAKKVLKL